MQVYILIQLYIQLYICFHVQIKLNIFKLKVKTEVHFYDSVPNQLFH